MKCNQCGCEVFETSRYGFFCIGCGQLVFDFQKVGNLNTFDYQKLISENKRCNKENLAKR